MTTFAYYALWATCDCVAAVCVDDVGMERDTGSIVADYIRRGLRVSRLDMDTMRDRWRCPEHPKGTPTPWDIEKKAAARNLWDQP